MRKLIGVVSKTGTVVIFINQIREKIGVMFGNPETTTGGRALKFYASVRLEVRRVSNSGGGELKEGDIHIGHKVRIKAVKNKVGPPFRETICNLIYETGLDIKEDMVVYAARLGVVELGAWCTVKGSTERHRRGDLTQDPIYDTIVMWVKNYKKETA
jgi:recombination protein RecA